MLRPEYVSMPLGGESWKLRHLLSLWGKAELEVATARILNRLGTVYLDKGLFDRFPTEHTSVRAADFEDDTYARMGFRLLVSQQLLIPDNGVYRPSKTFITRITEYLTS